MQKPTDVGMNRTGAKASSLDSKRAAKAAAEAAGGHPDAHLIEEERVRWSREARPVGTVPAPASVKGVLKTMLEAIEGHKATVFIDKLAERLAFERTGSRLYDALLAKFEAAEVHEGGPTRAEIEKIREDERRHYALLRDAIVQCGADPTAMTPSADVIGVASLGWIQVLTDPRTTLTQCLGIMLSAEAADAEGWTLLVSLAEELGFVDLGREFNDALIQEEEHGAIVRTWITVALFGDSEDDSPPSAA